MPERDHFREFNDFTLMCSQPMPTILLSYNENNLQKLPYTIILGSKTSPGSIYSLHRGTCLGCQLSKLCRKCKLPNIMAFVHKTERKTTMKMFWAMISYCPPRTRLLMWSSLKNVATCLVIGAVPFSTYASSYNRQFSYNKTDKGELQNLTFNAIQKQLCKSWKVGKILGLAFILEDTFYRMQRLYFIPAIDEWRGWQRG